MREFMNTIGAILFLVILVTIAYRLLGFIPMPPHYQDAMLVVMIVFALWYLVGF